MTDAPALSIVAPCFNEEQGLAAFLARMIPAAEAVTADFEIVLVDDGSTDETWAAIAGCEDKRVKGLRFSRNFGHQRALSAGLAEAKGARVLLIDSDLQDPPEVLIDMMACMDQQSADVVYGQRRKREGEGLFKRWSAGAFYRILRWASQTDIPADTGDFRLLSRVTVDRLAQMPERHRYLRGMIAWVGGKQVPFVYDRDPRMAGETGYSLHRMLSLAADGITGFSVAPLRFCLGLSALSLLVALGLLVYVLASVIAGSVVKGWTSLALILLLFQSVQLLCLGLLGEYLGRLYVQSKGRPLYIVAERTD